MKIRQKAKGERQKFARIFSFFSFVGGISALARPCVLILLLSVGVFAQNNFENRTISDIQISFTGADRDISAAEQFRLIAQSILIGDYSTVKIRETLQALYNTEKIVSAQVEATSVGENQVSLRFIIKRKTQAEKVNIRIADSVGTEVTEDQLLLRTNILNQGGNVTEQTLRTNAESIQTYLRDRGYYNAEVTYTQTPLENANRVAVTFQVNPKTQARVGNFAIAIEGFADAKLRDDLNLKTGEFFSRRDSASRVSRSTPKKIQLISS